MVIFDASRHFQAPSPDTAFAINTLKSFLLTVPSKVAPSSSHQDSLEALGSQLWLEDTTVAHSGAGRATALWIGVPLAPAKEGR